MNRPGRPPAPDAAELAVSTALQAIWGRHHPAVLKRLGVLERAVERLRTDPLTQTERDEACEVAHRLAGSLGTFGLSTASERARRVELTLAHGRPLGSGEVAMISPLVHAIAEDVRAAAPSTPRELPQERGLVLPDAAPVLLIVEDDIPLAESLALEAERQDLRSETAATPVAARASLARARPDAVLLDLTFDGETDDALRLLSELRATTPPIPVLVSTVHDELGARVEVARRGGQRFVTKSLPASEVIAEAIRLIEQAHAGEITVFAVDDDQALLEAVGRLLAAEGYRTVTLTDPQDFWQELERAQPDLVLLDIDMPNVNGLELCRVLRNDARWATVPVLILTAYRDAATIEAVFAAGADDHLTKPILPAELSVRVRNRVERLWLHRALAETDGLTGIANRHTAAHALERLLRLATRHEQTLAIALLDLDRFKDVNDRHGHAAGDDVLRRFGRALSHAFRGEDVVGRWGGEEFVVGMYGIDADDASSRLNHLLAMFSEERFAGGGSAFRVSFSAGVACHPRDGTDLETLVKAADAALYQAKDAGRARVVTTSATIS